MEVRGQRFAAKLPHHRFDLTSDGKSMVRPMFD